MSKMKETIDLEEQRAAERAGKQGPAILKVPQPT